MQMLVGLSVGLSVCLSSFTISGAESGHAHLSELIETWGFRIDDRGGLGASS